MPDSVRMLPFGKLVQSSDELSIIHPARDKNSSPKINFKIQMQIQKFSSFEQQFKEVVAK